MPSQQSTGAERRTVREILDPWMERRGFTGHGAQATLGRALEKEGHKVSKSGISQWFVGTSFPGRASCAALSKVLRMSRAAEHELCAAGDPE